MESTGTKRPVYGKGTKVGLVKAFEIPESTRCVVCGEECYAAGALAQGSILIRRDEDERPRVIHLHCISTVWKRAIPDL